MEHHADTCVLIVDDEPANRLILEDLVGEHYAVHTMALSLIHI